ncbi:UNVERIFIED_CONTAM: hypothetical protein PYX00_002391 [Menopon gallinae]|uniref:Uncharacterized protein n=1 Tax=Menopon gallinae TaxID=328185 RepID=A0AAW2IHY4_9NEOP
MFLRRKEGSCDSKHPPAEKLKSDNLESGRGTGPVQNGSTPEAHAPVGRNSEGKPKPPVPPKRSTLTYGKACSVPPPNATTVAVTPSESTCEPCHPLTSHLVTVTTNILSPVSKGLPAPKSKTQRVLSTFLPALPPKTSKSPLVQSPNFPRYQNFEVEKPEAKTPPEANAEPKPVVSVKEPEKVSAEEEEAKSPPSSSTSKTSTSSSKISSSPTSTPARNEADADKTPDKPLSTPEFSPSQTPPPTPVTAQNPQPPAKPLRKSVSKPETTVSEAATNEAETVTAEEPSEEVKESESPPQSLYLDESNENTNTIKRAPSNKDRLNATTPKTRTKSPIRVSFAVDDPSSAQVPDEKLSRTKRATKELKNIIHQIEYSESDYCSDDNCRTCTVRKTSSLSRRRSVSPRTTLSRSFDTSEGYTSCCEEDGRFASRKSKIAARRSFERKSDGTRGLCSCPLDNFVIDNRVPISRPNSSIGDYCSDSKRSRSVGKVKKNSGTGIKTPFWNCGNYESPGLGLIVTISSDGIDKEPRRTVQFISGGPVVNFGLGGTLGRYTKSKSQDKTLKIAGNSFNSDRSASDFEETFEKSQEDQKDREKGPRRLQEVPKSIPLLQKQKSSGDLKEGYSNRCSDDFSHRYLSDTLKRNKSPGEVLEHFGKLATSVTTSEISKISNGKPETELVQKGAANQRHSHENFRTVPPASFNHPDPYQGSAFVQYIRETLPHQPNSLPSNPSASAFDKYIRPGSGRFDKSLILPQQPKSDKPSAFERLCGDKIYSSRRGIYGKKPTQTQSVSGSLDCVWNKPARPLKVESEDESNVESDSRPASCTYEINRPIYGIRIGYPNYAVLYPEKEKAASGIPRTSKKGIIESETPAASSQTVSLRIATPQNIRTTSPQYFNPRSLENYKLSPGFKTDLSTLYSGVFYTNPKQENASSSKLSSDSARILSEYGIKYYGTLPRSKVDNDSLSCSSEPMGTCGSSGRGTGSEVSVGRKAGNLATASRIPEEAPPGTTVTLPPQYHPTEEVLLQDDPQSNRSQPAIGLKQTPKARVSL